MGSGGPTMPLTVGTAVQGNLPRGDYFRVKKIDGNWLWYSEGETQGWVDKNYVQKPAQARKTLLELFARNPRENFALYEKAIDINVFCLEDADEALRLVNVLVERIKGPYPLIVRARVERALHKFSDYLVSLRQAMETDPQLIDEQALELIDDCVLDWGLWSDEKEYETLLAISNKMIQLAPKSPRGYACKAKLHEIMKQDNPEFVKKRDAAVEEYIAHDRAGGLEIRGRIHRSEKRYDKALSDFTDLIRLNPKNHEYFRLRSDCWREKGDLLTAKQDLKDATQIYNQPDSPKSRSARYDLASTAVKLAKALRENKKTKEAISLLEKTAEDLPDTASISEALSRFAEEDKDLEGAVAWQQKAIAIERSEDGQLRLVKLFQTMKNSDQALATLQDTIVHFPKCWDAYRERASIYRQRREYDLAIQDLQVALAGTQYSSILEDLVGVYRQKRTFRQRTRPLTISSQPIRTKVRPTN